MRPIVLGMRVEEALDGPGVGVAVECGAGAGVVLDAGLAVACGLFGGAGITPDDELDPPPPPQAASNETSAHATKWRECRTRTLNR